MFNRQKKVIKQFDWPMLLTAVALCLFGLLVLRSATLGAGHSMRQVYSQIFATLLGFGLILIIQFIDMDMMKKLSFVLYGLCITALLATLAFGFGREVWGANSWLKLGPVTFQPSEFAKIGMILAFGDLLERFRHKLNKPQTLLIVALYIGFPLFLIMRQPDFGTTAVYLFFLVLMLFYAGIHWGYILGAVLIVLIAVPFLYSRLDNYQKNRILNFLDPSRDPLGSSYQGLQGTIAIGSGGAFGKGYMMGTQTQYGFIPEQDTDYIFATLAEEFGFAGSVFLILCYLHLLYRILVIAGRAKDLYGATICIGVAGMLFVHIFENIGMTIGLMPVTGIPLPFISYGGTFQLINLIGIGLVLSVSTQRRPLDFNASP